MMMFQFHDDLAAFYSQIPRSYTLEDWPFLMQFPRTEKQGLALLKKFAKLGILNMIPIGISDTLESGDLLVARLDPAGITGFGLRFNGYPSAITLSLDPANFIPSLLIHLNWKKGVYEPSEQRGLTQFVEFWGTSADQMAAFFLARERIGQLKPKGPREGLLWEEWGKVTGTAFFTDLGKCWQLEQDELDAWVRSKAATAGTAGFIGRIKMSGLNFEHIGEDDLQHITSVLSGDEIFDAGYGGRSTGCSSSALEYRTASKCIRQLAKRKIVPEALQPAWEALVAFATNTEKYNGLPHLDAARNLALSDPVFAFHLANTGSAFHCHNKGKKRQEFFDFIQQLSHTHGWRESSALCSWLQGLA